MSGRDLPVVKSKTNQTMRARFLPNPSKLMIVRHFITTATCLWLFLPSAFSQERASSEATLLAHWKLQGDCRDYSGNGLDGVSHAVDFTQRGHASFNGIDSYIEVPDSRLLHLDNHDFTISAWIKCDDGPRMVGDIINKYDPDKRAGINFHVLTSASGYSSISDSRNVLFGIDNGKEGNWIDCGRPSATNSIISTLIVYKGNLYAGIGDAINPEDACRIFKYEGGSRWSDCGRISDDLKTPSVMASLIHHNKLYIGTGKWDYSNQQSGGRAGVYQYLGNNRWKELGFVKGKRVMSIASYNDKIYIVDNLAATYTFDDRTGKWSQVVDQSPSQYISEVGSSLKFRSTYVFRDKLYGGAGDTIKRFEENAWKTVGSFNPENINQVHTFDTYAGKLYAGTWPDGLILRYDGDNNWASCGWVGTAETVEQNGNRAHNNEINDLTVYNGKMYAGAIPKGEVWRYDGGEKTTLIKRLVNNPAYSISEHDSWCRVTSMAIFKGELFTGTSTATGAAKADLSFDAGKVFRWEAGKAVTYDDDLGLNWRFVTAVREKGKLKLYIDGKLVHSSTPIKEPDMNVSNDKPLLIGFGSLNYFKGLMKDLRIYWGAVDENQIRQLYKAGGM